MNRHGIISAAIVVVCATPLASAFELKNISYRTGEIGKVVFSHKEHLRQKSISNNCKACHQDKTSSIPRRSMAELEKGASCGSCHDGAKAFSIESCDRCHPAKEVRISGSTVGRVLFSHRSHLQRDRCETCHSAIFRAGPNSPVGMAAMEKGKSCGACHNGTSAFGLEKCTSCHPAGDVNYSISGTGTVRFSHDLHLGMFGCGDCHGSTYGKPGSHLKTDMSRMEKGESCGSCHNDRLAFSVKGSCARCHKVA